MMISSVVICCKSYVYTLIVGLVSAKVCIVISNQWHSLLWYTFEINMVCTVPRNGNN